MPNVRITLQYDGTDYNGWQIQPDGRTIQGELTRVLSLLDQRHVTVHGAGRTDAGVHAEAQIANFKARSEIPLKNLRMALNSALTKDIVITHIAEAPLKFNAQHHAKGKLYRYTIYNDDFIDPFLRRYAAKCFFRLNMGRMRKAAKLLTGRHDFRSFRTVDGEEKNAVRTMEYIKIAKSGDVVYIYMKADGFLYNMARSIAGTLVETGRGKFSVEKVKEVLAKKDRRFCGPTMPAKGLCLIKVDY